MDTDVSCIVCWQSFLDVDPVILASCGHTMCKQCALQLKTTSFGQYSIKCPICSQISTYSSSQELKSNYTLKGLLQSIHSNVTKTDSATELTENILLVPKGMEVGTVCKSCSWYLVMQNKYICNYCGYTFCKKCSPAHFNVEYKKYLETQSDLKEKFMQINAPLELKNKELEARCKKLERDKQEILLQLGGSQHSASSNANQQLTVQQTQMTRKGKRSRILTNSVVEVH